jgi:Myb/SANT-like DNA-binding domain
VLLTILKQEYINGNFVNGQFTKSSWSSIVPVFNEKTSLNFTKEHLKNRLKVLRNVFRPYNELAVMSGWAWDSEHNVPRPEDPADWDLITVSILWHWLFLVSVEFRSRTSKLK